MKKMKRFVAILLAGVLALAMLTACGEEAVPSLGQRAENLMIDTFNKAYNTTYQNDADLKNQLNAILDKIDENGEIAASALPKTKVSGLPGNVVDNKDGTGTFTIFVVAQGVNSDQSKYQAIEVTEEKLGSADTSKIAGSFNMKPDAIGVATVVKNGKTYIGVSYKMTLKAKFE